MTSRRTRFQDAQERMEPGVVLRPWLQAFWWTNDQIRTSIQAAEDHGVGWILWNAVSNFDRAALSHRCRAGRYPDHSLRPVLTSGAPMRAASAVLSSGWPCDSRSAATRAR